MLACSPFDVVVLALSKREDKEMEEQFE